MNLEQEKLKWRTRHTQYLKTLIKESKITEDFYNQNSMKQSKILPAYVFPAEDPNDPMGAKEITKSKIKMAMSIMDKTPYVDLKNKLQNFVLRTESEFENLEHINNKEKEILNL